MSTTLQHWIGGAASTAIAVGPPTSPTPRPAPPPATCHWPARTRSTRRWRRRGGVPRLARHLPGQAHPVLFAFRELLERPADELAAIITAEHGKVLADAAGEVARGQEVVEFACGMPHLLKGGDTENASTDVDVHSMRQPLGVGRRSSARSTSRRWCRCGSSRSRSRRATRWSSSRARRDPSAANWMAALWREAGLPDGVFNVVHGDKEAVDALLSTPTSSPSASSGRPRSRGTSTRPGRRTASACRPSAARRTTWSCCPTPTSTWPPTRR